jgi:transcription antitermination factor NusG
MNMENASNSQSPLQDAAPTPVSLLPACPVDTLPGPWWLVHTKSRCEKALATDLDRHGIGFFLPLARMRRRHGGRRVEVLMPLFPSYLFLNGGPDERYATLMTHRAAQIIEVVDQEHLKNELRQIHRVIVSREPVDLYPGLQQGQRCRVTGGPLAGLEGVVLRRRDACRIYIGVEALGQSAELEIDPSLLETIA